ncbi:MAG TPA: hypothetical protein VML91_20090 [Burkholderiales bacterium]|nr:hypothetical protein [Burkholderiales bacterium]
MSVRPTSRRDDWQGQRAPHRSSSPSVAVAAVAQESKVLLADGPSKDKAQQCIARHGGDYIAMNSKFMDMAGWTASVTKMI